MFSALLASPMVVILLGVVFVLVLLNKKKGATPSASQSTPFSAVPFLAGSQAKSFRDLETDEDTAFIEQFYRRYRQEKREAAAIQEIQEAISAQAAKTPSAKVK